MWTIFVIIVLIVAVYNISVKRPNLFPPGPKGLPVVGCLFSVLFELRRVKHHHSVWKSWSLQYGNLLGLKLGIVNVVVVFGKELIKEVTSREVFDGRPDGFLYIMRSFGKKLGIVFNDGPAWSRTRRVALKYLKGFGYGSRLMEHYMAEECSALVDLLQRSQEPVVANSMFDITIVNIMWRLVAGKRYELNDKRLKNLCDLINRCFRAADMSGGVMTFMPYLRHVAPDFIGYTELKAVHRALHQFLSVIFNCVLLVCAWYPAALSHLRAATALRRSQPPPSSCIDAGAGLLCAWYFNEIIEEHQETIDLKNPRDVIDAFLVEMKNEGISFEELQVVCLDMLEAGVETVNNTAVFMLLHLVRDEAIQKRLQHEIDDVVGVNRAPSLSDRSRMVYTEAVIMETLRISSIAPVGIPRMALADAKLGGYTIPKGTFVLLALHDLHNGSHWRNPDVFQPERFLTKEGNLVQDEWLLPFGCGKRRCIGEGVARSELFMFLTHLLQKFNFKLPDGDPMPAVEPVDGLTLSVNPFKIVFEPRFPIS